MNEMYERYNEVTFKSYCMISVDHAIARGLKEKERRGQRIVSLNDLQESQLFQFDVQVSGVDSEISSDIFEINGIKISVSDADLAQALRSMMPQKRNILLLAYFVGKSDAEIGKDMNLPKTTIRDRRNEALSRIKELMRDVK